MFVVCDACGAIYECGCYDILEGDCDCDGNQLDALGECGGSCEADADDDGICDDVDPCDCDSCGVCNGPATCGCSGIPSGDCDCNGNELDALGVCGGNVRLTSMGTTFATTSTHASVRLTSVVCATGPAPPSSVAAQTSQLETATAMAINSMPLACAAVPVMPMKTPTASAMMSTHV